jgi:hypothetical protein
MLFPPPHLLLGTDHLFQSVFRTFILRASLNPIFRTFLQGGGGIFQIHISGHDCKIATDAGIPE